MKIRSVVILVGLAISFTSPTFAQQKDTADRRVVQQRDLLGVAKAVDEFGELHQALDEAYNKNDAAAVAAFFTEDALLVEPGCFALFDVNEKGISNVTGICRRLTAIPVPRDEVIRLISRKKFCGF